MNQLDRRKTQPSVLAIVFSVVLILYGYKGQVLSESFKPHMRVGPHIITKYDITQKQKFFSIFYGKEFSKEETIEAVISEIIKLEYLQKEGIQIDDTFVSQQVQLILARKINNKKFGNIMEENSIEEEFLFNTVKSSFFWNELIKKEFSNALIVTEKDLLEIKPQVPKVINPRVKISVIFVPYQIRGKENSRKLMTRLVQEIRQGASFSVLARRFSKDESSKKGGSLGWREITQFNDIIQAKLKKTKIGDVTDPISFSEGIYLFLLENRKTTQQPKIIDIIVEYTLIPTTEKEKHDCLTKSEYKTEGPFFLNKVSTKTRSLIETMKVNDRKKYDEEYDLLLCKKELDLSDSERQEMKLELSAEKFNKFGHGLYLNLRRNTLVSFYD